MFNDHKQYVEHLETSMLKRLASDFGVGYDRVTRIGEVQSPAQHAVICGFCVERRLQSAIYFEVQEPRPEGTRYRVEFFVDLKPHYRMIDNVYTPKVWLVLAGQCANCGHVYFVYWHDKRRNPYLERGASQHDAV